ncbi:50S ribosomal protein L3 [candidate division WWE3 bacterium CG08_land_8_20_14_0_20_43_13]|uniref:Large ribosomal subunit protein uL3 n=1 Tax=candidate division WWE3 bacterium CG08_land_8_20_14_0_20_43_13 TaxID=1975087 RepID=A0A2H0X784_UNCKA|nr:MAG: 50S ribosomal protein L3 [candidate division WWE3 bacterium CG08_land_8_20_14_0_20_43_13]
MLKILGQKLNMSQIFDQEGKVTPVTFVRLTEPIPNSVNCGSIIFKVIGTSKGKGFAGVVKRWGFAGGPATHGQSDRHRAPGSIGSSMGAVGHVLKGKKMAGHMGNARVTLRNRKIADISSDRLMLAVGGPLPGHIRAKLTLYFDYEA